MERVKKQGEDKLKKVEADFMFDRDLLEREAKEKLDQLLAKHKQALKNAVDKAKVDQRNQVDAVKNDLAKAKADSEREKKKLILENLTQVELVLREAEDRFDLELK